MDRDVSGKVPEVLVKPGVREFLEEIAIRGIKAGIATSNGRGNGRCCIKVFRSGTIFPGGRIACEVAAGKPARTFIWK